MELDELRQMSTADLKVKEGEAREEVFRLRLKLRTNQLDNASNYRKARRELAQIMTLLSPARKAEAVSRKEAEPRKKVNDETAG